MGETLLKQVPGLCDTVYSTPWPIKFKGGKNISFGLLCPLYLNSSISETRDGKA